MMTLLHQRAVSKYILLGLVWFQSYLWSYLAFYKKKILSSIQVGLNKRIQNEDGENGDW